jgi:hypothetical protein
VSLKEDYMYKRAEKGPMYTRVVFTIGCVGLIALIAAPYVVIQLLTGFKHGDHDTTSQQAWLMSWLIFGQIFGILKMRTGRESISQFLGDSINDPSRFKRAFFAGSATPEGLLFELITTLVLSVATFGGFTVVSKMILQEEVCTSI